MEIILYEAPKETPTFKAVIPVIPGESLLEKKASPALLLPTTFFLPKFLKLASSFLLTLSLIGIIYISLPLAISKIQSMQQPKLPQPQPVTFSSVVEQEKLNEQKEKEAVAKEAQNYHVDTAFSLVIPKISAAAKIIPNVDPANEEEYTQALKQGVAHAKDTGLPGSQKTIYLFAHSTNTLENVAKYNAIFFQLKDLTAGDKIIIFYGGKKFTYQVISQEIVDAKSTSWLASFGEEKLILQTCWPPGTSLKRLIVVAKPV